ncbi:M48 family metallopeptidase [Azoarcus sp. L1K30]|uniref:YgjP-like metallopeptidase domain-containing protein n=1 Tax=Azoarcus sp. L1K30 TaxID=2820277 RepID=UPI001B83E736|nr:YgjP-like metallopeptidase domain-containing protein [Azoarcus sp. L1K30]MBR0567716.1 M48 family metallopeptidase [Azoarcus sp. L1K30]
MSEAPRMKYLAAYPQGLVDQVRQLMAQQRLADVLVQRYPDAHEVRTDGALYDYVTTLKADFMRKAAPLSRVLYDNKLHVVRHALGTYTAISRVQGGKLKAKREIRIASVFRDMPPAFLRMIVVHELAHLKEREHDKAFYQLCTYMEPAYHQLEFDLRVYLCHLDAGGQPLWSAGPETTAG